MLETNYISLTSHISFTKIPAQTGEFIKLVFGGFGRVRPTVHPLSPLIFSSLLSPSLIIQRKLSCTVPGKSYTVVAKVIHLHSLVPSDFYVENMYCLVRVDDQRSRIRVTTSVNSPSNGEPCYLVQLLAFFIFSF